jgi:ADP-dependent NAD(P)H-hydrate dehydratase
VAEQVGPDTLRRLPLPRHDAGDLKDDRGSVLVIGGSPRSTGSTILAGVAALRAGAGKLRLATASSVSASVAAVLPEAIVAPLPERDGDLDPDRAAAAVSELIDGDSAVLVGPGVLDRHGFEAILLAALAATPGVLVVDAGAIFALGRHLDLAREMAGRVLAVPNDSELTDLGGDDPLAAARRLGGVISCRGVTTVIASSDGDELIDPSGNVGLATSGSGDVAAGLVTGLVARGASPLTAAVWSSYVHGHAGERLAEQVGPLGFLARELLDQIPRVLSELGGSGDA